VRKIQINIVEATEQDPIATITAVFTSRPTCTGNTTETVTTTSVPYYTGAPLPIGDGPFIIDTSSGEVPSVGIVVGSKDNMTINITEEQNCIEAVDYIGDIEVVATAAYQMTERTSHDSDDYGTAMLMEMIPDYPPVPLSEIDGPDVWTGTPSDYGISGGCPGNVDWEYPTNICGSGVVKVTVAGTTRIKTVRMENGKWVLLQGNPSCGSGDVATATSGKTRKFYCISYGGCGERVPPDGFNYPCAGGEGNSFDPAGPKGVTGTPYCDNTSQFVDYNNMGGPARYSGTCWVSTKIGEAEWRCDEL
jgi:hypothetical protein